LGVVYNIKTDKAQASAQVGKLKALSRNELARKLEKLLAK
jgi:hypothetical protein